MEAVAFFAGEPHSDAPQCACPVLTSHGIRLNDRWSSDERQLLAPLIPKLVGTRSTDADAYAADAYAAAYAAYAADAYAAAADRAAARRPVVLATIAAFERAIDITA